MEKVASESGSVFRVSPWISVIGITLLYILVVYAKHEILISDEVLLEEFQGEDFNQYMNATNSFRALKYVFLALFFIITLFITFALVALANSIFTLKLSSITILNVAVLSCSPEIVREVVIFCWFLGQDHFVSSEVFNFYPLSLFSLIGTDDTSFPLSYILQSLDFFLILKLGIIIQCFLMICKRPASEITKAVLLTYALPLSLFYALIYVAM